MTDLRLLITGSRSWPSEDSVLENIAMAIAEGVGDGGTVTIVHGACPTGADAFAHSWFGLPLTDPSITAVEEPHPADWRSCRPSCNHPPKYRRDGVPYCPAAGHRRNAEMVRAGADLVLAFPLPGARSLSKGTWNCVDLALASHLAVEIVRLDEQPRLPMSAVLDFAARRAIQATQGDIIH